MLYLILFFFTLTVSSEAEFLPVYHNINTVACTTYQWRVFAGVSVTLTSGQGTVCSEGENNTVVGSAYRGILNCTIYPLSGRFMDPLSLVTVTFCFYNIKPADSGMYQLETDGQRRYGTVFVMEKPTKPQISPTTVVAGRRETLTCTSRSTSTPSPTGQVMTYTWKVNNKALSNSRFSTDRSRLIINTVRKKDKDNIFQCTAKETQGLSSDRIGIKLIVHYPPEGKPFMSYSTHTYITGSTVTLSCSITEDGNPQATWTWRCGNRTSRSGITNSVGRSNLTFVVKNTDNNQPCTCTASSSVGPYSEISDPATLDIRYAPQGKPVLSYSTLTYVTGSSVKISCSIAEDGNPPATWTWSCGTGTFSSGVTNSVGRSDLTFVATKADNNQFCTCTASSSVGHYSQTSDPGTLNIRYPPQGRPVMSYSTRTYLTGSHVKLSCRVTEDGNPIATWTWRCGSRIFNTGITNSVGRSDLMFIVTRTDNNQPCTCTASSPVGPYNKTSYPATLYIKYPPEGKPVMSYSTLNYIAGTTISLSCSITKDGNPKAKWTWRCGSRTFNCGITNSIRWSNLTFVVATTDDNQPCTCTASSPVQLYRQTSDPATLIINAAHSSVTTKMVGMYFAGFISCVLIAASILFAIYLKRRKRTPPAQRTENDHTYESIQGSSSAPTHGRYENVPLNTQGESKAYENTRF